MAKNIVADISGKNVTFNGKFELKKSGELISEGDKHDIDFSISDSGTHAYFSVTKRVKCFNIMLKHKNDFQILLHGNESSVKLR